MSVQFTKQSHFNWKTDIIT